MSDKIEPFANTRELHLADANLNGPWPALYRLIDTLDRILPERDALRAEVESLKRREVGADPLLAAWEADDKAQYEAFTAWYLAFTATEALDPGTQSLMWRAWLAGCDWQERSERPIDVRQD